MEGLNSPTSDSKDALLLELFRYKRRVFLGRLLWALGVWLVLHSGFWLLLGGLELVFWFSSGFRLVLFWLGVLFSAWATLRVLWYGFQYAFAGRFMSNKAAAARIGGLHTGVQDRLTNYLELQSDHDRRHPLVLASLGQRYSRLRGIRFARTQSLRFSFRWLFYGLGAIFVFGLGQSQWPAWQSAAVRLLTPHAHYVRPSPFSFALVSPKGMVFLHEPTTLAVQISGPYMPESLHLHYKGSRLRLRVPQDGLVRYPIAYVRASFAFQWEADGHLSPLYSFEAQGRAQLQQLRVKLDYPAYTRAQYTDEEQHALADLRIPEGTQLNWALTTQYTDQVSLELTPNQRPTQRIRFSKPKPHHFVGTARVFRSGQYRLRLRNSAGEAKEALQYQLSVQPDLPPRVQLRVLADTLTYAQLLLAGYAEDDYGIRQLRIAYTKDFKPTQAQHLRYLPLARTHTGRILRFSYEWELDTLLQSGESLYYAVEAWDNCGIRASQRGRSSWQIFRMPRPIALREASQNKAKRIQQAFSNGKGQVQALQEALHALSDRLKTNKESNFQDTQRLSAIQRQKEALQEAAAQWKAAAEALAEQLKRLTPEDKSMQARLNEVENLLKATTDPQTEALYKALQKLMQDKGRMNALQQMLSEIQQRESLMAQQLMRSMRQIEQLRYDLQLEQTVAQLKAVQTRQDSLQTQTQRTTAAELKPKADTQQKLNQHFGKVKKSIEQLRQLHKASPSISGTFPKTRGEESNIQREQQRSADALDAQQKPNALDAQQKAQSGMKRLQRQLNQLSEARTSHQLRMDIAQVHRLMNNLIRLSIAQEQLHQTLSTKETAGAAFDSHTERQLDLQTGARPTLDSLATFGQRSLAVLPEFFKDLQKLNTHFKRIRYELNERRPDQAKLEERHAMTQLNALALTLGRVLDQLIAKQRKMGSGSGGGGKPGQPKKPSISDMQQQLSQQLQELKRSGKVGRQLSEGLARLMAEQELLRRELEALHRNKALSQEARQQQKALVELMKLNEKDLAEKNLSERLLARQKELRVRMLSFEQAQADNEDLSNKREAQQARRFRLKPPPEWNTTSQPQNSFEDLQRKPLPLTPYYENEVQKYLERLHKQTP